MLDDKPTVDATFNLKWKTSTEDWVVELLHLIRRQKKPTIEKRNAIAKIKECHMYWNSDTALWERHQMTVPMPTSPVRIEEQGGN